MKGFSLSGKGRAREKPFVFPEGLPTSGVEARPIRVCFLIDRLTTAGTESQLVALIEHLDRRRVEPFLCIFKDDPEHVPALEPDCCPVLKLGVRSLRHPRTLYRAARLAWFLRRHRIDVLQVHFPDSTLVGVPVAQLAGVPYIVRTRYNLGYSLTRFQRWLGRAYNAFVDRTVANCEPCRQSVLAVEGPSPESVVVLENGVDLSRFEGIPPLSAAAKPRRIGLVGNLRPVKDLEVFVRAAALVYRSHPDVTFQIAGEGELRPHLQRLIAELGLQECFTLPGTVSDVPAFLARIDMAILCSRSEGMSNALLEYMAAGRAIVATAVGANDQLIRDETHGLLVVPQDPVGLAAVMDRLLRNPAEAARLGAAARCRAFQRYSREAMVQRFEAFFEDLVGTEP